ncbi:MAG: 1-(5-phosphoribosyl)-5-[(5-phosphoribosylamino)methylideneamino] imidazole-4-carboxamide isomerase, partial [Oscillospiraceae bacterium]|nr:1-(5-phosphoribosyl)-5-[(5-phosphoribosylamino)methylideneamino] imidazole-4-carboxamide isomerase [Oscillospiraceae bacterium]
MEIYPAIDLREGRVIRLTKGDFNQGKIYGDDPAGTALSFREAGARRLHLIDLDGAKDGKPGNADIIGRVAAIPGLFLQVGGGIRTEETIKAYLELGAGRVILGTVAVEDFGFLSRMADTYGEKIAVSVDAREGRVATRGWLADSGLDALDFCKRLEKAGVSTIIYTDINLDGMMAGTGLEAYKRLSQAVACDIIASGGVSSMKDI